MKLSLDFMEDTADRARAGRRGTALDMWLGRLAALLSLGPVYEEPSVLVQSGGRQLLTGKDWPPQCGHSDFEFREQGSPGNFVIATRREQSSLH